MTDADDDYRLPGLPRYVRINTLKIGAGAANQALRKESEPPYFLCPDPKHPGNRAYYRDNDVPDLLVFKPKGQSDISRIPMIGRGEAIVQQKASCFPALALAPPPGATVIDGCAAPGNKTSHLAALMQNTGCVYAFEQNARRCDLLREMMLAKGARIVVSKHASFLDASPDDPAYADVTHILLDPSCSSSGMSRNPEQDPVRLRTLADDQEKLVLHAMRFPALEALVYSTCSIHEIENEMVVHRVLSRQHSFQLEPALPWWPRRGHVLGEHEDAPSAAAHSSRCERAGEGTDEGQGGQGPPREVAENIARCVVRCTYPDDQTIGFFLARFVRTPSADGGKRRAPLPPSATLASKLEVLAKARAKRSKGRGVPGGSGSVPAVSQQGHAAASPRVTQAAGTGAPTGRNAAPATREIPQWRLERDAGKKRKRSK